MVATPSVIAFIGTLECEIPEPLGADSSLIESGLLDSLALYKLALWIEEQVGTPIDLASIEIAQAWETPSAIAAFIAAERGWA